MFESGTIPNGLNKSIICLLPKGVAPESLSQFRPISLCNVLMKVVTKVLANRLKSVMPKLTGKYQSSFVPGRSITDNIVIAQEMVHSLSKRKGKKGGFILKVDLEKAYDRVDWGYLEEVLQVTCFQPTLVWLILQYITLVSLSVSWNGELLEAFKPSRGLCQGDPLSPYLFVLCMEVLSQKIERVVHTSQWSAVQPTSGGPKLSHIFFADDLLLFSEASFSQARLMEHILADFCGISGQRVSRAKSRIWFSPNTPLYLRNAICSEFHIWATSNLGMYLGIPLFHGRMKKIDFTHVLDKATSRLAGWKTKTLSRAARMILIKSTLATLANYTMQTVMLPTSTTKLLDQNCRNFFWGSSAQHWKLHIVAWKRICTSKQYMGLGIPNLHDLNMALLAKLVWILAQQKENDFMSTVLATKYGGWHALITGEQRTHCSIIWHGLGKVATWIQQHSTWEVGDGQTILFWHDIWLCDKPLSHLARRDIPTVQQTYRVRQYWHHRDG